MACTKKGKPAPKTDRDSPTKGKQCTSFGTKTVRVSAQTKCVKGKKVQVKAQNRKQKICKRYG